MIENIAAKHILKKCDVGIIQKVLRSNTGHHKIYLLDEKMSTANVNQDYLRTVRILCYM